MRKQWYIITRQRAYHQHGKAVVVSHHTAGVYQKLFRNDDIQNFVLKNPPKDHFEEYAKKIIDRAYFIVLNKIDELDGTNERLLKYYKENIVKLPKV